MRNCQALAVIVVALTLFPGGVCVTRNTGVGVGAVKGYTTTEDDLWLLYMEPVTDSDAIRMTFRARRITPLPPSEPETIVTVTRSREYNAEVGGPEIEARRSRFAAGPDGRLWAYVEERLFVRSLDGSWGEAATPAGMEWDRQNEILLGFNGSGQTMFFYTRGDYNTSGAWAQYTTAYTLEDSGSWSGVQIDRFESITVSGDDWWAFAQRDVNGVPHPSVEHRDPTGSWTRFDLWETCDLGDVEVEIFNYLPTRPRVLLDGSVAIGFTASSSLHTRYRAYSRDHVWSCEEGSWYSPSWNDARFATSMVSPELDGTSWTLTSDLDDSVVASAEVNLGGEGSYLLARTASEWVLFRASLQDNLWCDLHVSVVSDDGAVENYSSTCSGDDSHTGSDASWDADDADDSADTDPEADLPINSDEGGEME